MRITRTVERWFKLPGDPDGHEALIRHIKPGEVSDVIHSTTKFQTDYKKEDGTDALIPNIQSFSEPNDMQKQLFLLGLVGWKNMFDEDGEPLEFNEVNKIRALREIDGYKEWVTECQNILGESVKQEAKDLSKNS